MSGLMGRAFLLVASASAHPQLEVLRAEASALSAVASLTANLAVNTLAPTIPAIWSSNFVQSAIVDGQHAGFIGGSGRVSADSTARRFISAAATKLPWAPAAFHGTPLEWLNVTNFADNDFSGIILEGAKYEGAFGGARKGFQDLFGWAKFAKLVGKLADYNIWSFSTPLPYPVSFILLTTMNNSVPVFMGENVTIPQAGGSHIQYNITYNFTSFIGGSTPPWAQALWKDFNRSDFITPPLCPLPPSGQIPKAKEQTIYIFHPKEEFNISQQDNGDVDGDVFFVCEDLLTNSSKAQGEDYQWITQWTLDLVPRWGQYQNCNNYGPANNCLGNEHFWVGHEAALGLGQPNGGQCVDNPLVGEWFSLPLGGKCPAGKAPDGKACTWSPKRVKTLDAQCMLKHGYIDACKKDGRAPFAAAKKIFLEAFASDDPAKGGCPALPGP